MGIYAFDLQEVYDSGNPYVTKVVTEPCLVFGESTVDHRHQVLGLERVGDKLLLLKRAENRGIVELYDTEGNLLDKEEISFARPFTGVEAKVSAWEDGASLILSWSGQSDTYGSNAMEHHGFTVDAAGQMTHQFLKVGYPWAQAVPGKGSVLTVEEPMIQTPETAVFFPNGGPQPQQTFLTVYDETMTKVLYRGEIVTDENDDLKGIYGAFSTKEAGRKRNVMAADTWDECAAQTILAGLQITYEGENNMIEGKQIFFTYGFAETDKNPVLNYVDLQIPDGQIVGLFGENGAGKSTLLRLMAGLLVQKDRGCQILLDGKPATQVRGEIACIFEEGTFLPDLTPKQYGDFLADFFPKFDRAYYDKLVKFFKLEEKAAKHMSRGQKAKLEIAAGLAKRTKYIFMDEPFLGKDALTRQDFMKILSGSLTGEETLILVTHELESVETFIDRAIVVHKGKLAADVEMDDLHHEGKNLMVLLKETVGYDENAYRDLFAEEE